VKRWALAGLISLALVACGDNDSATPSDETSEGTPGPTVARKPPFEWGACAFDIPVGVTVDCGYLTVPEDRSRPDGPTIRLHVGVFESESEDPAADPILYLGGGPGENSTEATSLIFDTSIDPFLEARDYVVLDQRGTGFSRPNLDCPELDSAFKEHIDEDLTREEERSPHQAAIFECGERLVSEGVNLAAYRSAESAADVNDLRLALGYDAWNIHGVSYGTRLALTVMRERGETRDLGLRTWGLRVRGKR